AGADSVPAALAMKDRLLVRAVEAAFRIGLPTDAGAGLLIEIDGPAAGLDVHAARATAVCRAAGVREIRVARDEAERAALWKCRKRAFGAVRRRAPNYCTQDGVVPPTAVPEIVRSIAAVARRQRLPPVFDPEGRANPHKIFPDAKVCVETRAPRRQAAV